MTLKLYDQDSFIKEFYSTVVSCEEYNENWAVVLDKTAFFPEGGGQPSDTGYIDNSAVLDVQISGDKIHHIVDKPLPVGSTVTGVINWGRRFDFMQQHSGEHIVSGIAHKFYDCENVGFHLGADIVTLDFDKPLNREQILDIEKRANEKIYVNVKFNCYYPDNETLKVLNYRSKKELEGDIRIVEIENTDMCACCAPHVKTSGEIGTIKLLNSEALRGGVRIELKCGKRALKDYNSKYENIYKISVALCSKQDDAALSVDKLIKENKELNYIISTLKKRLIEEKVNSFTAERKETVTFEDDLDIKELQIFADSLCKKYGGIRGVFSGTGNGFAFAICGEDSLLIPFFVEFKKAFAVRGGGRNGMVQGSVVGVKEEIENFFES